jgi:hypothetical protein
MSDTDATQARQDVAADVDEIIEHVINANMLSMPYDVYSELFDAVDGLGVEIENLQAENAQLRKLVSELWLSCPVHESDCNVCQHNGGSTGCELSDRMRELGIEVSG